MNQSTRNATVVVLVVVAIVAAVWWTEARTAAPAGQLLVAGDVRADIRTVSAPPLTQPTPDYAVGIPRPAGVSASGSAAGRSGASGARNSRQPVVAGMLKRVLVREGDRVESGAVVAEIDDTLLVLGIRQAELAARKAHQDASVLGDNVSKLNDAADKLTTAREKIVTAERTIAKAQAALLKARRRLLAQRAQLRKLKSQRPQLEGALNMLRAQAAKFPPGTVPAKLQQQIAQLTKTLAMIEPGLAGIAKGLKTVDANLAKVNAGAAKLPAASAKIDTAETRIDDAKATLRNARSVLEIVADGQDIAVDLAKTRLQQALVRAPIDGVVTFARRSGTVAIVGAPLVRIAPDVPQLVDTYLTAEQAAMIATGSEAEISFDSATGGPLHGRVTAVGSSYVFPPTSFPTQVVHMTRALKVTIELDAGDHAPSGTPVDVTLHTSTGR